MEEEKTNLSKALELASNKARYDAQVKTILSNKPILAWILKCVASEFNNESIESIIGLIEGEPEVSTVPVYPGKTNAPKITGMTTEDIIPYEGEVTYDIKFYAYTPDKSDRVKLIINVEAQKAFYPGYDLVTRAIYYAARSLSSQKDTEFTHNDYDNIKKVYSIWVCMDTPKYVENNITSYRITPIPIHGDYKGEKSRYDLLEAIMICLGSNSDESDNELIKLLDTLLSNNITVDTKKQVLCNDFGIEPTIKLIEEMNVMCNLSDLVIEQGFEKGIKQGIEDGFKQGIEQGIEQGVDLGTARNLIEMVDNLSKKTGFKEACELLEVSPDKYEAAKELVANNLSV